MLLEKPSVNIAMTPWGKGCINYGTYCWEFWEILPFVILLGISGERGRERRDEQRAGGRWDGVGDTVGFKPSLRVLALLTLLILAYVIFKLGMNSNLMVQKYILHLE